MQRKGVKVSVVGTVKCTAHGRRRTAPAGRSIHRVAGLAAEISRAHQARNTDRDETDGVDHDFYDDYDDEPIVETI